MQSALIFTAFVKSVHIEFEISEHVVKVGGIVALHIFINVQVIVVCGHSVFLVVEYIWPKSVCGFYKLALI